MNSKKVVLRRKFTEEEKQAIIARYKNGEKAMDLARELQGHPSMVYRWTKDTNQPKIKIQASPRKQKIQKEISLNNQEDYYYAPGPVLINIIKLALKELEKKYHE